MRNLEKLRAENKWLPKDASGIITSPLYLPLGHPMLSVWRQWLKTNPRDKWPAWLRGDIQAMRPSGKRLKPASAPSTPGSGSDEA